MSPTKKQYQDNDALKWSNMSIYLRIWAITILVFFIYLLAIFINILDIPAFLPKNH